MSAVVFTDGLLLLTLLAAISETMPLCGIYNIVYMAIAFGINWRRLPYQLIRHSAFEALALRAESGLTKSAVHGDSGSITQYMDYLTQLGDIGKKNGLHQLIIDIAGSLNVMLIMAYGIVMLKQMALSYPAFMAVVLASYFITILTPRICNSMQVIYDGSIILSRKAATYQKWIHVYRANWVGLKETFAVVRGIVQLKLRLPKIGACQRRRCANWKRTLLQSVLKIL